jgi:hypothetical protein
MDRLVRLGEERERAGVRIERGRQKTEYVRVTNLCGKKTEGGKANRAPGQGVAEAVQVRLNRRERSKGMLRQRKPRSVVSKGQRTGQFIVPVSTAIQATEERRPSHPRGSRKWRTGRRKKNA